MAPLAHAASIWGAPGSWNVELTQGDMSRKELPGRAGRKESPVIRALPVHPWALGWERWIDHAAERWTHLPCDAPLLTHGCQVAQNQLCGLGFSRAALSAARAKGQSELPPAHAPPPGLP